FDPRRIGPLDEITRRPGTDGGDEDVLVLVHRDHQDPGARCLPEDAASRVDSRAVAEFDVHEHDVDVRGHDLERLPHRTRLAHDVDPVEGAQQCRHTEAEDGMVVDDRNAYRSVVAHDSDQGSRARTTTPRGSPGSMPTVPPTSRARSRMLCVPTPTRASVASPRPSSTMSRTSRSPSAATRTVHSSAPECR